MAKKWQYDEFIQAGSPYTDKKRAAAWDLKSASLRDPEKITEHVVGRLGISKNDILIDIGCGTGAFALEVASVCSKVYCIDVSEAMLEIAKEKAQKRSIGNVVFVQSGFLTYVHRDIPVDFIYTAAALHHLPDFWKSVAFSRMHDMLKEGGLLFYSDVVFCFNTDQYEGNFDWFIAEIRETVDDQLAEEAVVHLREEFSTYSWIIEGLAKGAGFELVSREMGSEMNASYVFRAM